MSDDVRPPCHVEGGIRLRLAFQNESAFAIKLAGCRIPQYSPAMLILVKLLHTVIWAMLAGCIVALPVAAHRQRFDVAFILTAIILTECGILGLNHGRCPLTDVATWYTQDRRASFDIFLPAWLARYNKTIFGTLFVINELIVLWYWARARQLKPAARNN